MIARNRLAPIAAALIALFSTACSDGFTSPTSAAPVSGAPSSFAKGVGGGGGGGGVVVVPAVGPLSGTWVLTSPVSGTTGTVTLTANAAGTVYAGTMFFAAQNQAPDTTPYDFNGGFQPDGSTIVFGYRRAGGKPGLGAVLLTGTLSADGRTITGSSTAFWPGDAFVMTKL